jgi:hypothetical protein
MIPSGTNIPPAVGQMIPSGTNSPPADDSNKNVDGSFSNIANILVRLAYRKNTVYCKVGSNSCRRKISNRSVNNRGN